MAPSLGKRDYRFDERTLRLGELLAPPAEIKVPEIFDFDEKRAPFPMSSWGNDSWGDCVIAGRANHALRLERVERRRTLGIVPSDVVAEYKSECQRQFGNAPQSPGDPYDTGLYVLEAIKDWRNDGWGVKLTNKSKKPTQQKIAAYGEIDQHNSVQIRSAIYLLHGVQMGLSLPRTAWTQLNAGKAWDVEPGDDPGTQPGSWGGHLVYCKHFDQSGIYCITWGREQYMTNAFVNKYCDECWAVVDDLDSEKVSRYLDVQAMVKHLHDIGAQNIA